MSEMSASENLVHAGSVEELQRLERKVVQTGQAPVLVLFHEGRFHAVDNRCPHMGFPLSQGDVHDGLLDCHWHHARFDVSCGATLDPWADDVDCYAVVVEGDQVYVDPTRPPRAAKEHGTGRLRRGIEENLRLVTAKAVIELAQGEVPAEHVLRVAARYGALEQRQGWQPGLSILSAMAGLLPALDEMDRRRALVHSCARIAGEIAEQAPRRPLTSLASSGRDRAGLKGWLRETVEVRDEQGAERVMLTLVREHGAEAALDATLAACTDHRYADVGHMLDFALKCAELSERLDDDELVAQLYASLVPQLVQVQRMEETSAWRRPVDVAGLVADAWPRLVELWPADASAAATPVNEEPLVELLLGEDPAAAVDQLLADLGRGVSPVDLAEAVVTAATRRILAFGTANELRDWDTVHHTLTYANAAAEGLRRVPSQELFRAVLDGAMSVYLDRFLNVPAASLPAPREVESAETLLTELLAVYDGRSAVDEATGLAWSFLHAGGSPARLLETLGTAVLREDAAFHDFQQLELAWRRLQRRGQSQPAWLALTATARWIAARYPTPRANEQTFDIARRLERGDAVFS